MRTLYNTKIFIALIAFLALGSCGKDLRTFPENESSAITKIDGPTTAKVGEELLIKVTLQGNNGCAVSGELKEMVNGNIRTVAGKVNYKGEVCSQAIVYLVVNYGFKASTTGTYEIKFLKADKSYLIHTIKVD